MYHTVSLLAKHPMCTDDTVMGPRCMRHIRHGWAHLTCIYVGYRRPWKGYLDEGLMNMKWPPVGWVGPRSTHIMGSSRVEVTKYWCIRWDWAVWAWLTPIYMMRLSRVGVTDLDVYDHTEQGECELLWWIWQDQAGWGWLTLMNMTRPCSVTTYLDTYDGTKQGGDYWLLHIRPSIIHTCADQLSSVMGLNCIQISVIIWTPYLYEMI